MNETCVPADGINPPHVDDRIATSLADLVCSYVDLKLPVPEDLVFMVPDEVPAVVQGQTKTLPVRPVPSCFSPLYSADTPTASMRKLGPVAWHAVRHGWAEVEFPTPVALDKLRQLHDPAYVDAFLSGKQPLASAQGWGWTPQIRDGVLAIQGGQLLGAKLAWQHGIAANIAQGFHHAHYQRGAGFCTFNGLALIAQEFPDQRIFVLDCDQHGGDGTEEFTRRLPNLFNYSINGMSFGMRGNERSICRTIQPLTGDFAPFAEALTGAFAMIEEYRPDLIVYQAGVDGHRDDPLGVLGMTTDQLLQRDRLVFEFCCKQAIPVLFVLAGGYQEPIETCLLPLHLNTFRAAAESFKSAGSR